MTMTTPTAPPMVSEAEIAMRRVHIEEFIELALTHKLDALRVSFLCPPAFCSGKQGMTNLVCKERKR